MEKLIKRQHRCPADGSVWEYSNLGPRRKTIGPVIRRVA